MAFLKRKKKPEEEQKPQEEAQTVAAKQPEEESVEDILKEIKSIVSGGEEDDTMELTEMVELDEPEEQKNTVSEALVKENLEEEMLAAAISQEKPEEENFVDVLAEIDSELSSNQEPSIQEPVQAEEEPLSLDQITEEPIAITETEQIIQQTEEIIVLQPQPVQEVLEEIKPAANFTEETPEKSKAPMSEGIKETLISKDQAEKSAQVIKNLLDNIPRPKIESPEFRNGNTVEDIVMESLRPMLKQWLDKNLEKIVYEVVEKEIRKIIPREE